MSLYLLLSTDSQFYTELEILFEASSNPATLIRATTWEEISAYQASLQDIDGILIDLDTSEPPSESHCPVLLLGTPDKAWSSVWPHLSRPLPADTPGQLVQLLHQDAKDENAGLNPEMAFLISMLREIVHDMNNQLTTLRGNLPIIITPDPEDKDSVVDMQNATEKANHLVHMIEGWFPDCRPDPHLFPLNDLVADFTHFANKLYSPGVVVELTRSQLQTTLSGDPAYLCSVWLQLLGVFAPDQLPLEIHFHEESSRELTLRFVPKTTSLDQDDLPARLKPWLLRSAATMMHCRIENSHLICRLPKRLIL